MRGKQVSENMSHSTLQYPLALTSILASCTVGPGCFSVMHLLANMSGCSLASIVVLEHISLKVICNYALYVCVCECSYCIYDS